MTFTNSAVDKDALQSYQGYFSNEYEWKSWEFKSQWSWKQKKNNDILLLNY